MYCQVGGWMDAYHFNEHQILRITSRSLRTELLSYWKGCCFPVFLRTLPSSCIRKGQEDRVPRPMRGAFRNFVVVLRKSRPVPWCCWEQERNECGSAGERGGSGNTPAQTRARQDKEEESKSQPHIGGREPARPETRPPWTAESQADPRSLLLHHQPSQNAVAYPRNSLSSWFRGSMGSAGWFLLGVLPAVVFRCHPRFPGKMAPSLA